MKNSINQDIFQNTKSVCIELSNLCNYANIHKKCPLYTLQSSKTILSSKIAHRVLATLKKYNFFGTILFSTYNEPLMDPRLFEFIRLAHYMNPKAGICIWTNGYYLNEMLVLELVEAGVTELHITAYSKIEKERFEKIQIPIPYNILYFSSLSNMDDRLTLYKKSEVFCSIPCSAPLKQIIITAKGEISLCCYDWKRQHCFGNLYKQSLEEILRNGQMQLVYNQLIKGERHLNLCKRCTHAR